jgi:transcriptional regulator with XRE-family HTH domain
MEDMQNTVAYRLRKAMSLNNVKQVDLAELTKIPKSSINQYLSGYAEPKTDRIYLIAKALDVDPVLLMGFNVPMKGPNMDWVIMTSNNKADAIIPDEFVLEYMRASEPVKKQIKDYAEYIMKRDGDSK